MTRKKEAEYAASLGDDFGNKATRLRSQGDKQATEDQMHGRMDIYNNTSKTGSSNNPPSKKPMMPSKASAIEAHRDNYQSTLNNSEKAAFRIQSSKKPNPEEDIDTDDRRPLHPLEPDKVHHHKQTVPSDNLLLKKIL